MITLTIDNVEKTADRVIDPIPGLRRNQIEINRDDIDELRERICSFEAREDGVRKSLRTIYELTAPECLREAVARFMARGAYDPSWDNPYGVNLKWATDSGFDITCHEGELVAEKVYIACGEGRLDLAADVIAACKEATQADVVVNGGEMTVTYRCAKTDDHTDIERFVERVVLGSQAIFALKDVLEGQISPSNFEEQPFAESA